MQPELGKPVKTRHLLVTYGPIQSSRHGYFVRSLVIYKHFSKKPYEAGVLEFVNPGESNDVSDPNFSRVVMWQAPVRLKKFSTRLIGFDLPGTILFQIQAGISIFSHRRLLSGFDRIVIEGGMMPLALITAKLLRFNVVFDTHAINIDIAQKMIDSGKKSGIIRKLLWFPVEGVQLKLADSAIAVSERDKAIVVEKFHLPPNKISVIENQSGVVAGNYYSEIKELDRTLQSKGKKIVTFVGDLSAVHNIDAAEFITSKLSPKFIDDDQVEFWIIGRNINLDGSRASNVRFFGFVKHLEPYLLRSDVCIAPLAIGGGVKTKVIDYIELGRSVVATDVALEGIDYHGNMNIHATSLESFPVVLRRILLG